MAEEQVDVDLSPRMHQEYTFRHRHACRTPTENGQEYLTNGKEYIEPRKTRQDSKEPGEKTGVLVRMDLPSAGQGIEAGVRSPHQGNCLSQRRNILKLNVKQLICGSLNRMRIRQSLLQPYRPWTGMPTQKAQKLDAGFQGFQSHPRTRAAVDCIEMD